MLFKDFLAKEKIAKAYSYKEIRDGDTIEFGWELADDIKSDEFIVSYPSSSKKISEKDLEWSKEEGKNVASVDDYQKYFFALTGYTPDGFLNEWGESSSKELESYWKSRASMYRDNEGAFILNLAKIISEPNPKGFTLFGRIFRKIKI